MLPSDAHPRAMLAAFFVPATRLRTQIRDAAALVWHWRLDVCTIVVTLEPCPMCAGAMVNSRVGQLVYGAADPRAGRRRLADERRRRSSAQPLHPLISDVEGDRCGALLVELFAARRR